MALTLFKVFEETKKKYKLSLLTENANLSIPMTWVYLAEDIDNMSFIRPGSLIITTGLSCTDPKWLYQFIDNIIKCDTCGLIINTGKYLTSEDISPDILNMCQQHNYPLMVMPWDVHIADLSADYCNRIFLDNQENNLITSAFKHIIRGDRDLENDLYTLDEYGYPHLSPYRAIVLKYDIKTENMHSNFINHLIYSIKNYTLQFDDTYYTFSYKEYIVFITPHTDLTICKSNLTNLCNHFIQSISNLSFTVGIGNICLQLSDLQDSYSKAIAALLQAACQDTLLATYDEMGFLKLLLEIKNRNLLQAFYEEQLAPILSYDKEHNTNYQETLYQYLIHNGSIQEIGNALYCHRNTVNYRMNIIRELFGPSFSDLNTRHLLYTAFIIKKYLETFPET